MQSKFPLFCQFFKSSHTVFIEHLTCAKSIIISYLNWNMLTINYMKQRYDFHSEMYTYILAVFKNTIKHKENCFLKPTSIIHFWIWKVNGKVSEYQASLFKSNTSKRIQRQIIWKIFSLESILSSHWLWSLQGSSMTGDSTQVHTNS